MIKIFKKIIIKIITWQAQILLKRKKPTVIAITGNLGKTTTKDFIYSGLKKNLLSQKGESLVLASKKSMNSEFGIPLTILKLQTGWNNPIKWLFIILKGFIRIISHYPYKYLVLEVGADAPGDIKNICSYIKPDITVLTGFAEVPVHIEFFDNDRNKLIREKKYLVENIKDGGLFIYNADDEDCKKIAEDVKDKNINLKSFSIKDHEADISASDIFVDLKEENKYITQIIGSSAKVYFKKEDREVKEDKYNEQKEYKIKLEGVVGEAVFYSLLPALLVSKHLNLNIEKVIEDIENTKRTSGRMRVLKGIHNSSIIDDSYNSSPKALKHGISIVEKIETKGKKILVLGDMLELGDFTKEEHENIGKLAAPVADILITSGIRAKIIAESAIKNGMNGENVYINSNSLEAGKELVRILDEEVEDDYKMGRSQNEVGGDLVFVKGSQGARMEKVVSMIIDHSSHIVEKDIVRQEKDWKLR